MQRQQPDFYLHTGDSLSFQSNYTSSSRLSSPIGPGRTLGFIFLWLGDWLEQIFLKLAHKRGLGTNAVFDHLIKGVETVLENDCIWRPTGSAWINDSSKNELWYDVQKLLKYARSNSIPTESLALQQIIDVITTYPCIVDRMDVQNLLGSMTVIKSYRSKKVSYSLQHKRALACHVEKCFEDNKLSVTIGCLRSRRSRDKYLDLILQTLSLIKDPDLSFVALRYSNTAIRHVSIGTCCPKPDIQFWVMVFQCACEIVSVAEEIEDTDGLDKLMSTILSCGENPECISPEMGSAYQSLVLMLLGLESTLPRARAIAMEQWRCLSKLELRKRIEASA